jgi:hypothetical protein
MDRPNAADAEREGSISYTVHTWYYATAELRNLLIPHDFISDSSVLYSALDLLPSVSGLNVAQCKTLGHCCDVYNCLCPGYSR